jgi:kinetochore protein Spc25
MSTAFEPTLSMSAMRPPLSSAHAPSMADSLPSINFGFDELRDRMAKFTVKFDAFIETGRKRVLEERNQFRMNVAELHEDRRMKKKDIEILQLKTQSHQQTLAKEEAETKEMNNAIAKLNEQRERKVQEKEKLLAQIADAQRQIDEKIAMQRAHAAKISSQAVHDIPELDFWTSNLGLRIEGAGINDRLKFVFTYVDERDWEREAWFELCTERRDYEIGGCFPKLEREQVERVVERLNENRELGGMLKGMRELFVEAMKA